MGAMATEVDAVVPPTTGVGTATGALPPREPTEPWPLWQRIAFRFFAAYFILEVSPLNWLSRIPGMGVVLGPIDDVETALIQWANTNFWHVRETLIMPNGSGDTSFGWAIQWTYLALAAVVCVVWSILDRKRTHYDRPLYWVRTIVRYWLATVALSYGIIKLFALQMPFPTLSNLATPLGDLLPMRLSWLFIGYSFPYQFFSGAMETIAGLLLLYRRTVLAGLFAATGAFVNVVMINLAYDVPVKIFSSNLLAGCLFLLALDSKRLLNLLVLNRPVPPTRAWDPNWQRKWQRWLAIGAKAYMLWFFLWIPFKNGRARYIALQSPPPAGPFKVGMYDVTRFSLNGKDVPFANTDTLRWKDVIIDNNLGGSVNTQDEVFWKRYHRGYFRYRPDTAAKTVAVWKISAIPRDSTFMFTMRYEVPDTNTIRWHTKIRNDSVLVEMKRMARHFQLTERQFHWLSEYNR
jgi:hypothetical protein